MSDDTKHGLPTQKDIEKDISEYLTKKYGERVKIIGIHAQTDPSGLKPVTADKKTFKEYHFDLKPEDLYDYLDEYVVRQDEAKAVLATKICTHFNRIRYSLKNPKQSRQAVGQIKSNVLLIGPTGVGKTYLVKLIAQKLGVPFVKGDATKFSETGYVGADVDDLVRDLVREAGDDIERAQYGIIYVDEIDKIASSSNRIGPDVSRAGVQRALLKPMEETEIDLKVPHDPISQMEAIEQFRSTGKRNRKIINTKNILFIMSGAFNELENIIIKRIKKQAIGFEGIIHSKSEALQYLKQIKAEDLIQYGFESEFIGRLPVIASLDRLTVKDLHEILINFNCSVIIGKKLDFQAYNIKIQFDEDALLEIAKRSFKEKTGARGLVSVLEKTLLSFEKKLPSTNIQHLAVTKQLILNPDEELKLLLNDASRKKLHEEQYEVLANKERGRIFQFIQKTKKAYFKSRKINLTKVRTELIASQCQLKISDIGDVLGIFVDHIQLIRQCAKSISEKCEINVSFSDEATDWILSKQPFSEEAIKSSCQTLIKTFEYGFGLLKQKKHVKHIVIPVNGLQSPEKYINDLVSDSFKE